MRRAVTFAALFLAVLVCAELAWRAIDGKRVLTLRNFVADDMVSTNAHARYDAELGWVSAPNIREPGFTTDAGGARPARPPEQQGPLCSDDSIVWWRARDDGTCYAADKANGMTAGIGVGVHAGSDGVLAVGDSFTVGSEVKDGESWPAQLETATGRTVYNPSAGAWGTDQVIMQAQRMVDRFHFQTVVLGFYWQDIQRAENSVYAGADKPYFDIEKIGQSTGATLRNVPVPRYAGRPSEVGWATSVAGRSWLLVSAARAVGWPKRLVEPAGYAFRVVNPGRGAEITCRLLMAHREMAPRVIVLMMYAWSDAFRPDAAREVVECSKRMGLETIDTWQLLRTDGYVLEPDGKTRGHPSPEGHRLIAEAVRAQLEAPQ